MLKAEQGRRAHREGGAFGLHDVQGLDVGARRHLEHTVVIVGIHLGEGRRPLPGTLYAHHLHSTKIALIAEPQNFAPAEAAAAARAF